MWPSDAEIDDALSCARRQADLLAESVGILDAASRAEEPHGSSTEDERSQSGDFLEDTGMSSPLACVETVMPGPLTFRLARHVAHSSSHNRDFAAFYNGVPGDHLDGDDAIAAAAQGAEDAVLVDSFFAQLTDDLESISHADVERAFGETMDIISRFPKLEPTLDRN